MTERIWAIVGTSLIFVYSVTGDTFTILQMLNATIYGGVAIYYIVKTVFEFTMEDNDDA